MSFTTKYFKGTVTGSGTDYNSLYGTYTATVTADANDVLSGTWNYTGTYVSQYSVYYPPATQSYALPVSGNIDSSGTLTGTLLSGLSNSWKVYFSSADPQFVAGTYGFLDRVDGVFKLNPYIAFDLPFVTYWGLPITERFGWGGDLNVTTLPPIISIDAYTGRPPEQAGQITVTLARSGADLSGTSSVVLSTEDGAALAGSDYTAFNQIVTFMPGIKSVKVLLGIGNLVIDDNIPEPNENFHIRISDPANASLGFSTGDITVIDNDSFSAKTTLLNGSAGNETLTGTDRNDKIFGFDGDDIINGLAGDDTLDGGSGNDTLDGGAGNDKMTGGKGDDVYFVDATKDAITEKTNEGIDTIHSSVDHTLGKNVEILLLDGVDGLSGTGNEGNNTLTGNEGDNTLAGKGGNDTLEGGAGADTFKFDIKLNVTTNVDTINDFTSGEDVIYLSKKIFAKAVTDKTDADKSDGLTLDGNDLVSLGSTQGAAHFIYDSATGNIFYDADGEGGKDAVQFATLTGHPTLVASDLHIF